MSIFCKLFGHKISLGLKDNTFKLICQRCKKELLILEAAEPKAFNVEFSGVLPIPGNISTAEFNFNKFSDKIIYSRVTVMFKNTDK